ncbi:type IV secretion system protein [Caballeronia zhejiangensis]|uniref:type IV secretion system protein n=1 Tax=Caballeronia zhejiangensis TaxID=871203 RepID=UPI001FD42EEC|nr:type IV secretion system protein [Caballeronia zhejiangensis]
MRLFKNKRWAALSTAPGSYAEEDPSQVIFETSTRLTLEANRWMLIAFGLAFIAAGAVWTRQPPPSVTRVVGVSADTGGHPIVTELVAYKPDSQAVRTTVKDMAVRWFTIEPVLSDRLETSRMTANINSVKAQMIGAATGQFRDWLRADAPFQAITANPKLIREVDVRNIALLQDNTVLVEFTTTTSQAGATGKPDVKSYALTLRYQIVAPTAEQALTTNPFGIFIPFFRLERTA